MKIRLFVQTYTPANAQRKIELEETLSHNREILEVITVERQDRITFKEWFSIINEYADDCDISILANSDIKFNATIKLADCISSDECFALTRWENTFIHNTGADSWIFKGKIKEVLDCDFGLGVADCDYAIAERLHRSGYKLRNPSFEIITNHCHKSAFRTYYSISKVEKPHITHIPQLYLKDIHLNAKIYTYYTGTHVGLLENFLRPSVPKDVILVEKYGSQLCESGVYKTAGFTDQMKDKCKAMLEMVEENELFVWLDCDVKILSPYAIQTMIEDMGDADMAFQKDKNEFCCGVFIGRRNERTLELFRKAYANLEKYVEDQAAINALISECGVRARFLSPKFWNFSHFAPFIWDGKLKFPTPSHALLVHANWVLGVENKAKMLSMF